MKKSSISKLFNEIICLLLFLIIMSCGTPKNITYFQGLKNLEEFNLDNVSKIRYKPHDIISILVTASDTETVTAFNNSAVVDGTNNIHTPTNYLVDSNGMIEFPVIGSLKVANLTSTEIKLLIKRKLKTYINNPIIDVKLENFKITVLGEVRNPGQILVNNENITIIEALGLAGDLNINGKRTNIMVIRKVNNKKIVHKVDLTSKDIFNSPVYHLNQNDIVYIEPNKARKKISRDNEWTRILTTTSSILGIIISVILITR